MLILVVIVLIILYFAIRKSIMASSLTQEDIDSYVKELPEFSYSQYEEVRELFMYTDDHIYSQYTIMPKDIRNENDFKASFHNLMNAEMAADKNRQVLYVNKLAIFMIKYYGKYILKYGNNGEKAVFKNNINLLKMNNLLK